MSNVNIVAEFDADNLKLLKHDVGIVYNAEIDTGTKKDVKKVINEQQQRLIAVVAAAGATEERTSSEKALLYSMGFSELIYVQPTVALAAYFDYKFVENTPIMSVVIGEEATDIAIILADKVLYSGILDIGVNSCVQAINDFIMQKYNVESGYSKAKDIFMDIASLLPNDNRFAKYPEFIIKAEQVRTLIYPLYEKIIGAINHLLSEASVEVIRQINSTGVLFGGVGAQIRGLSEAVYSVIGLQSMIADDPQNALIFGAGNLLSTPKVLLKMTHNA